MRSIGRIFLLLALGATLLAGCSSSGDVPTGPVTLKLKPKQGETYKYRVEITGGQGSTMDLAMTAEKVENGQVTMVTNIEDMSQGGQPMPDELKRQLPSLKTVTVMDENGKVISSRTGGADGPENPSASNNVTFPPGPVKIGDSWTADSVISGKKLSMKYTLTGFDNIDGKQAAIIEAAPAKGDGKIGTMTLKGNMRNIVEMDTGMPLLSTSEGQVQGQPVSFSLKRR